MRGVAAQSDDELSGSERFWFQVDADRNPPSSFPIAGLGLALGTDTEGAGCDASIGIDELTSRITFTRRRFRGYATKSIPGGMSVTVTAPIVDDA
jgi:hypothetical protein